MSTARAIGIDLGTTYSCVGVWQAGQVEIIPNDQGDRTTPSYVAFTETERLYGNAAKNQAALNPKNSVFDVKRLIGRKFDDADVQEDIKYWSFKVVKSADGSPLIEVEYKGETKRFTAEEISAMVLVKMKETAETYLGGEVEKAVITVPAYFNDAQRQATRDAGTIAGLNVLRIINEPTAAAIAYNLKNPDKQDHAVLVFDLGGGTLDVSLLRAKGVEFKVITVAGNTHLGGEDFDNRLVEYCANEFKRKYKVDITNNGRAMRRLRAACERAKRTLSSSVQTSIEIDALAEGIDYFSSITRARFEELNNDLFQKCIAPIEKVLEDAKMTKAEIDKIVLVGGSTRIPKVQKMVSDFFDGKDPSKSINPDEAVAYGAAVLASNLTQDAESSETAELMLQDVVPLSLGIELELEKVMSVIIPRNTPVPCTMTRTYATIHEYQTSVFIQVYEGEFHYTKDNRLLGTFNITGIPTNPPSIKYVDVHFKVNADGILSVTAEVLGSGLSTSIVIERSSGSLTKDAIDRMVKDAKKYKMDDETVKGRNDAKNQLEQAIYHLRELLNQQVMSQRLALHEKKLYEMIIDGVIEWLDNNPDASQEDFAEKLVQLSSLKNILTHDEGSNHSNDTPSTPTPSKP